VNVAAQALEQSVLETKDKEQLLAIAKALGLKVTARSKKADIIDGILASTGTPDAAPTPAAAAPAPAREPASTPEPASAEETAAAPTPAPLATGDEPMAEWEMAFVEDESSADTAGSTPAGGDGPAARGGSRDQRDGRRDDQRGRQPQQRDANRGNHRDNNRDGQRDDTDDADGDNRNRNRRAAGVNQAAVPRALRATIVISSIVKSNLKAVTRFRSTATSIFGMRATDLSECRITSHPSVTPMCP